MEQKKTFQIPFGRERRGPRAAHVPPGDEAVGPAPEHRRRRKGKSAGERTELARRNAAGGGDVLLAWLFGGQARATVHKFSYSLESNTNLFFTCRFFPSRDYPAPLDDEVYLQDRPRMTVYVK